MKNSLVTSIATLGLVGAVMIAPVSSFADGWRGHRQQQRDQWKGLAIGSAAVGVFGLLTHNDTLSVLGLGGAAYSGYRYSQDHGGRCGYDNNYRNESGWASSYPAVRYDSGYSGYGNYDSGNGNYNYRARDDRNANRWNEGSAYNRQDQRRLSNHRHNN